MIVDYLDPATLVSAARAGVNVDSGTFQRAQHSNVWTTLLKSDYGVIERLLKGGGNVFLMGLSLEYLWCSLFEISKEAPSPLPVIMSWTPGVNITLNPERFNDKRETSIFDPFTHLQAVPPWTNRTIAVSNPKDYIKDEAESLTIPVLHFRDTNWKLYTVPVLISTDNQYCFTVENQTYLVEKTNK